MKNRLARALVIGMLGVSLGAGLASAKDGDTRERFRARLIGAFIEGIAPGGKTDSEARTRPGSEGRIRSSTEVEDVNLPTGTTLDIWVGAGMCGDEPGDVMVGEITLDDLGGGDLNLDSRRGDAVPDLLLTEGRVVSVCHEGSLVLIGTLDVK